MIFSLKGPVDFYLRTRKCPISFCRCNRSKVSFLFPNMFKTRIVCFPISFFITVSFNSHELVELDQIIIRLSNLILPINTWILGKLTIRQVFEHETVVIFLYISCSFWAVEWYISKPAKYLLIFSLDYCKGFSLIIAFCMESFWQIAISWPSINELEFSSGIFGE